MKTNILFANVEILQQTPIGNLIVVMSGSASDLEEALHYLQVAQVDVEIIDSGLLQNSKVGDPV
ncbi:NIL domain-containing protein [Paenibacillus sp. D2_2]|uniref:NIL domain-containing protein n=1 Tax=Paenibacillus sp. D2_2 TaxID=3073092 RepID=UPI00281648DF|nr:NIL domain-containing protein [Paenibacillus sp. D2_2]WMT41823.1 NIL domain-containing protein [Paenibacillus sp. D2_2]